MKKVRRFNSSYYEIFVNISILRCKAKPTVQYKSYVRDKKDVTIYFFAHKVKIFRYRRVNLNSEFSKL